MVRLFVHFLMLALIIGISFSGHLVAGNDTGVPFKVVSWNIRLDTDHDGSNAWRFRRDAFCSYVQEQSADIIGLQEVLHHQLAEIITALPEFKYAGVGRADGITEGEYSPVLYRAEKYELMEKGDFWLSEQPDKAGSMGWDAACERIVSWVKLREKLTGSVIYVFNTHFDHVGQQARLNSVRLILERIALVAGDLPVLLIGDLNITPKNEAYKMLAVSHLADAREWAKSTTDYDAITYTGFDFDQGNDALIDFIFHSQHFKVLSYTVGKANTADKFLSDHLPVIVKFGINPAD